MGVHPEPGNPLRDRRFVTAVVALLLFAAASVGGLLAWQEAGFEREAARIGEVLDLNPGVTVADVGAGDGRYAAFLAARVAPTGHVFATEIEQDKVDDIRQTVASRDNVTVILGALDDTRLPEACCDRILLRRVYHHFLDPDPMVRSLLRSLKPGGVIAIVDFLPRRDIPAGDGTPDQAGHGTTIETLTEEMTRNGFELVRRVEDWPGGGRDYCVLFRRPPA